MENHGVFGIFKHKLCIEYSLGISYFGRHVHAKRDLSWTKALNSHKGRSRSVECFAVFFELLLLLFTSRKHSLNISLYKFVEK